MPASPSPDTKPALRPSEPLRPSAPQYAAHGRVRIAYETFGETAESTGRDPLLLMMGLSFQMLWWPDGFCEALARRGFAVARFDNRDAGLSTHFDSPLPDRRLEAFRRRPPVYRARDMVADALTVMNALGWASAHVVGASLGGAMAQRLAAAHPERVRSLTSMLSLPADASPANGARYLRPMMLAASGRQPEPRPDEAEIRRMVKVARAISSPGYPFDVLWARDVAERCHARSPRDPSSTMRQVRATQTDPADLAAISAPTLVMNGLDDPMVRPRGGLDTARRIEGAWFVGYPGMGHDFPQALWDPMATQIRLNAERAGSAQGL